MNILIAIDLNYVIPAKVMLKSLHIHSSEDLDIYLLYQSLPQNIIEDLHDFVIKECGGAKLHPIYVDKEDFAEMPLTGWFSVEIYFRVIAPFVLPDSIKRILWIDADIIVQKDISALYNKDLNNAAIGVVRDMGSNNLISECIDRLSMQDDSVYFNSGMILFDLTAIRTHWTREIFINQMKGMCSKNLIYPDQDMLNLIFEKNKLILPDKWNYQLRSWSKIKTTELEKAAIIHFVGKIKPWNFEYENKVGAIWWKYYSLLNWQNGYYLLKIKNLYRRYIGARLSRLIDKWKQYCMKN